MKLRLRFLLLMTAIFIGFIFVIWLLTLQLINQVNQKWGSEFIERQVAFDKYRTLSPLIHEIELARKMAADSDIIQMALHENDPALRRRGIATMENYRFNFRDNSYFAAIAKSGNYYFNDAANQYQGMQLRYVLSPSNSNDKWFYATIANGKEYQVNLDPDVHLGVTKVWINVLIKNGRDTLGVIGTGIDLTSFLKETVSVSPHGGHNLFIDKSMAIQLNTDPGLIDYMSIAKDVSHRIKVDVLLKNPADIERLQLALRELETIPDQTQTFWVEYEGGRQLLGVAYLPEVGWYDLTLMDTQSLFLIEDKWRAPILFGAVFLIALITMGIALQRWVLKPISLLQKSTDRIQHGDFDIDYQVLGSGEIGYLLKSFAGMAKYVRDTNRELENRVHERTDELHRLVVQQKAILDNRLVGIATVRDRKVVWCNSAYADLFGYAKDELIASTPRRLYLNEEDYRAVGVSYANIEENGIVRFQHEFIRKDGRRIWADMSGASLNKEKDEAVWIFVDVTERKLAEQKQQQLSRALKLLSKCDSALVRIETEQELLSAICQLTVEIGGYLMAWVGFAQNDAGKIVFPVAQFGYEEGYLDSIPITWADTEYGQGPVGTTIRTGSTSIIRDFLNHPKMALWSEAAKKRGYNACIALPLVVNKQVIGAFAIYSIDSFAFGNEELELLEQLANDLAYGIQALRTRVEHHAAQIALKRESEKNAALLRNASDGIHIIDAGGNVIEVSDSFCAMLGFQRDEVIGKNISTFDVDFDPEKFAESIRQQLTRQGRAEFERQHRRKDGSIFDVEISTSPLKLDGESVLFSSSRDITERKRAEETLRITASVFDNTHEGIIITDAANTIIDVNPAFTRITGYSRGEVLGKNPSLLSSGCHDKEFYAQMWQSLKQEKVWRGELWNRRKSGEIFAELLSVAAILGNDGNVVRYAAMFSDISHIKEHEAELNRVAHYDALTGIPNRVLLADRMKQAIFQTAREQSMMAICYLDLDGFKPINDSLGHDAGDQVLIEVAKRIEHTIRGGDTVARMGGDEFVVLLLGQDRGEECVATLERLLISIAHPITVKDKLCSLSTSIGVSIYPLDDEDPDTLLRHADQAMYVAKQSGKNRFHIYDPALDRNARDQHEFLKSIRYGLEHDQFELFYQPKVNLRTGELVGAEALIRWRHPERGLLAPAEFLRIIENTDLDIELGEWVTAAALAQLNLWRSTGLDIEVSINISGYHLESPRFVERLQQKLAHYPDLPFGKLQIEVLETVALNDIEVVREIIETCRRFGVGFALDDFGTGYSSLSYLSSLPVDVLKIDQSFVRDMLEDKGDMAIVQGIIALARAFDRQTVAEGIETEEHYTVLQGMGCELGQGYGIARPMPAGELTSWRMEKSTWTE